MIEKITDPKKLAKLMRDLEHKFREENSKYGHVGAKINVDAFLRAWSDQRLLNFNLHVWANIENEYYDSCIMFQGIENALLGEKLWQEYFWVSKNPRMGVKLFHTAINFARKLNYQRFVMGTVENYPNSKSVRRFYEKIGMKKDSELWIGELL